jgi:hypothetical protein
LLRQETLATTFAKHAFPPQDFGICVLCEGKLRRYGQRKLLV